MVKCYHFYSALQKYGLHAEFPALALDATICEVEENGYFSYLRGMAPREGATSRKTKRERNEKERNVCGQKIWGTEAAMCEATALKSA